MTKRHNIIYNIDMKTAIVTGASGSIGSAIAYSLVKSGYFVACLYNTNLKSVVKLNERLVKEGYEGYIVPVFADLNKWEDIKKACKVISDNFKHIDLLVNNAGVDLYKLLTDTTEKEWDYLFNVNVKSAFAFSKYALKSMVERKSGKIINISSIWGISGGSMETAYSTSKSALIGLTKSLAKEVAPSGITVNCVCPGVIDTPMNDRFSNEEKQQIIENTPLLRMGKSEEVAGLVEYLASEKADFITGQVITIDGGFIL